MFCECWKAMSAGVGRLGVRSRGARAAEGSGGRVEGADGEVG